MNNVHDSKPVARARRSALSATSPMSGHPCGGSVVPVARRSGFLALLVVTLLVLPTSARAGAQATAGAPVAARALEAAGASETADFQEEGQEVDRPRVEMRRYAVRHTNMSAAFTLAQALCTENRFNALGTACSVEHMEEEGLIFIATPDLHARLAEQLETIDRPPRSQRFHVVVLEALEGTGMPAEELHQGAIDALEDIRSFLPYRNFQVLANGWLETSRQGQTSLSGPGNFELALMFRGDPRSGDTLVVEHFELSAVPLTPEEIRSWNMSGEPLPRRVVLESNFSIDVGETKVLGTSKLNGDGNALVVLLTAVE